MRALTFEVIARAVFGLTDSAGIERLRRALASVQMIFFTPTALRRDLGSWSPWGRFRARLRAADELIYEEIARRRGESDLDRRGDILSLLLRVRDEEGGETSDVELMTILLAGQETIATALAFAFDLLLREPSAVARLRDGLGDGEDRYLDAIVSESLCLRLVIDAAERNLTRPRTIGGWAVATVAAVGYAAYGVPGGLLAAPVAFLGGGPSSACAPTRSRAASSPAPARRRSSPPPRSHWSASASTRRSRVSRA